MIKGYKNEKASEYIVEVVVSKEEYQSLFEKMKENEIKNLKVSGFRKGKLPKNMVDKYLNLQKVASRTVEKAVAMKRPEADKNVFEQKDLRVISFPEVNIVSFKDDVLTLQFIYPLAPDFSNISLDKVEVKFEVPTFDEKKVDAQIEKTLKSFGMLEKKEGPAQKGDTVVIDFKGFIDDVAFEGGEAQDYSLELGSNQFIAGFEDQLLGKEAGWKGDITVTFPENYYVKEYRSKDAVFEINLKEVQSVKVPELNEETVALFGMPEVKTVAELKESFAKQIKETSLLDAKNNFLQNLVNEIESKNEIAVAKVLIDQEVQKLDKQFSDTLKQQGIKRAEYLKLTKSTEEDIKEELTATATKTIKDQIVYQYLVNTFSTEVTQEQIDAEFEKIAAVFKMDVETVKKLLPVENLKSRIMENNLIAVLVEKMDPQNYEQYKELSK
ncbi:trigger factor [Mycoplasmopsis ciconiae]|uniref:Trigger factor n=1 Tax=Mycoplasmopsis ciconiae TaxID=561067 RepID=A0ABU7MM15_9BACT|nr:trigger factor [Mycoplasmopsis ciconiae]